MHWLALAAVGLVTYFVGKARCWWSCDGSFTCDVESDMPDVLKQQVLTQAASATSAVVLQTFAVTLYQAGYIQSAYCLSYRAWVLNGSHGTAPIPPSSADIAAAQARRAAAASHPAAAAAVAAASLTAPPPAPGLPLLDPATLAALTNAAVANLGQQPGAGQPYVAPTATGSVLLPTPGADMEVGRV